MVGLRRLPARPDPAAEAQAIMDNLMGFYAGYRPLLENESHFASEVGGAIRFSLGIDYLWDGVPLIPVLTGMFALTPMIALAIEGGSVARDAAPGTRVITRVMEGVRAAFVHWRVVLRGSAIGTAIGVLPGLGGTVASFIAYSAAQHSGPDPSRFGKGEIVGVIAPESANNAKDGGALLPTIALGIPGSPETAVFLGILILHGMTPGPIMLLNDGAAIYALIAAVTLSCLGASALGVLFARPLSRITTLDADLLVPMVMSVALTGSYALRQEPGDVLLTLAAGLGGWLMMRQDYPRITYIIALVLGADAERSFHQTWMISDGQVLGFKAARPQAWS